MIFNQTYELKHLIPSPSQEELYNTPEFFAMSWEQIFLHQKCPEHLRQVLRKFDWKGRPNFVQVRIQDFRKARPPILGNGWHVDINTILANGREHVAKSLHEFRSMVASFGGVTETQFVRDPFEVDITKVDPYEHAQFAGYVAALNPEVVTLAPDQLAVYTTRDAHRANPVVRPGNIRMIIVTVECDADLEPSAGRVIPSLRERVGLN